MAHLRDSLALLRGLSLVSKELIGIFGKQAGSMAPPPPKAVTHLVSVAERNFRGMDPSMSGDTLSAETATGGVGTRIPSVAFTPPPPPHLESLPPPPAHPGQPHPSTTSLPQHHAAAVTSSSSFDAQVPKSHSSGSAEFEAPARKEFNPRERSVPSSRLGRVFHFASLGVRMAVGTAWESTRRMWRGTAAEVQSTEETQSIPAAGSKLAETASHSGAVDPSPDRSPAADRPLQSTSAGSPPSGSSTSGGALYHPFLSEANAERLAVTLCRMRGAALKLGQMLSIQDDTIIPPQVQKILQRVRDNADVMPRKQLEKVLVRELGPDWQKHFQEFQYRPIAAASIGQVHRAVLTDGMEVAMKIQYPGVAESIESDLSNLRRVISMTSMLPKGLYVDAAIAEAKKELTLECDYLSEARHQRHFQCLIRDEPMFIVPDVIPELSTSRVLTSTLVKGLTIDQICQMDQFTRNKVAQKLLELCLREVFEFRYMQTDPNWSNFFYDHKNNKLILLDFGACRSFDKSFVDEYIKLVYGSAVGDRQMIIDASIKMGFLTGDETEEMMNAHASAATIVGEPFAQPAVFDFSTQRMTRRVNELVPAMLKHRLTAPPPESYSLHRKLSGSFLLCFKLGAKIQCHDAFMRIWERYSFD